MTKGYNSYRGRSSTGKIVLVIVLVLALLGGLAFLYCQNHLVYDDQGNAHLVLPWSDQKEPEKPEEPPVSPDDVEITREEPQRVSIAALQAKELALGRMEQDTSDLLAEKALVIPVKGYDGAIGYDTDVTLPNGVREGSAVSRNNLKKLLAGNGYAVARLSCLADTAYAHAQLEQAGLLRDDKGDVWYDINGECWLDPTKPGTLTYVTALCQECAALGFDEILLDNFAYPTTGNTSRIFYGQGTDKTAALTAFAEKLREALPKGTILSVAIHAPLSANSVDGLTAALLQQFDRIYTDASVDTAALTAALEASYVIDGRIVPVVNQPTAGSYLMMAQ